VTPTRLGLKYPQNLRMDAPRGAGSGCEEDRREAGRGGERIGQGAGRSRCLLVPAWMACQQQRGDNVIRRCCGENGEVHAEPRIGSKSGPCGAKDCMSRKEAPNQPPSLVKGHSPDEFACPDVLPFFFYFVVRGVCRSTMYARVLGGDMCGSGRIFPPGCAPAAFGGTTVACADMDAVACVRLRVFSTHVASAVSLVCLL